MIEIIKYIYRVGLWLKASLILKIVGTKSELKPITIQETDFVRYAESMKTETPSDSFTTRGIVDFITANSNPSASVGFDVFEPDFRWGDPMTEAHFDRFLGKMAATPPPLNTILSLGRLQEESPFIAMIKEMRKKKAHSLMNGEWVLETPLTDWKDR